MGRECPEPSINPQWGAASVMIGYLEVLRT
jgi:hypothetical protein